LKGGARGPNLHTMKFALLCISAIGLLSTNALAQLEVSLHLERTLYLRGEPIEAAVTVRNLAGKDVMLRDLPGRENSIAHHWFGFQIERGADNPIAPYDSRYRNGPVNILAGESVERKVNLLRLYPINELGSYKAQAAIYFAENGRYITSQKLPIEITDGKSIWSQTVGVPAGKDGGGGYREMELLSFQLPRERALYARVTDESTGEILCTYPLGHMLIGMNPSTEFDESNTLHIFHMVGPNTYWLSKIGVNGEWLGQRIYNAPKGRATLRKKPDGSLVVVGATRQADKTGAPPVPKLSDRPVSIPGQ
jgi:hypothetical protein